jgi:hypothetical protein
MDPGQLALDDIIKMQREGRAGLYEQAMAGYLKWLAPQMATIADVLKSASGELESRLSALKLHGRTAPAAGDLYTGAVMFIRFAQAAGAISETQAHSYLDRILKALSAMAIDQKPGQDEEDIGVKALDLLRAVFMSGAGYVSCRVGGDMTPAPADWQRWGWQRGNLGMEPGHNAGALNLGYINEMDAMLELNREATYQALTRMGGQSNELRARARTVWRRWSEVGICVGDKARNTPTQRRYNEGEFLIIPIDQVYLSENGTDKLTSRSIVNLPF